MKPNRHQRRAGAKAAAPPPAPAPQQPDDLDVEYPVVLTGRDIDHLGNLFDGWVRSGGVVAAAIAVPLLEKIVAARRAAHAKKLAESEKKAPTSPPSP